MAIKTKQTWVSNSVQEIVFHLLDSAFVREITLHLLMTKCSNFYELVMAVLYNLTIEVQIQ